MIEKIPNTGSKMRKIFDKLQNHQVLNFGH